MNSLEETKKDLIRRLRRVEGQVKGLQRMIDGDKDCVDILIQVAAARAALNKVGTLIIENHTKDCLRKAVEEGKTQEIIDEMVLVLEKFIR